MTTLYNNHAPEEMFYRTANGMVVNSEEQTINKLRRANSMYILPQAIPQSSAFSSGSNSTDWNFIITANNILHICEEAYLVFTLMNNGASTMTLVDGISMFDYVWTYLQNTTVVQEVRSLAWRTNLLTRSLNEQLPFVCQAIGVSPTTFASNVSIPAGGSQTFYLPIVNLISSLDFPLWRAENLAMIQFRLRAGSQLITAGSADTNINDLTVISGSVQLNLYGYVYPAKVLQQQNAKFERAPITFRYMEASLQQIGVNSIVANTPFQNNLNLSGNLSSCLFQLTVGGATGTQLYNSVYPITTLAILQNNTEIESSLGDNLYFTFFNNLINSLIYVNVQPFNQAANTNAVYAYSFSTCPDSDIADGSSHGSYPIYGNIETIRLQSSSTASNVILNFLGWFHSYLVMDYKRASLSVFRKTL